MAFRHIIVAFLLISGSVMGALAQTVIPETLLNMDNKQIIGTETSMTYRGGMPAVLIEPTKTSTTNTEQAPVVLPSPISIQTPFGHERTAAFMDHTTDFVLLIQIVDADTIRVEEKIQFVNTQPEAFFQRVLPQIQSVSGNDTHKTKIELLNVTTNGQAMPINTRDVETAVILTGREPLSVGVHTVTVTYLVHGAIHQNRSVADILLGLTGPAWPLLTERFNVIVLFPHPTQIYQKELLFGTNQMRIPDNFSVQVDENGNTVYQTTHILPAFSDVRLHMIADAAAIPPAEVPRLQRISGGLTAFLICLGIMLLYTLASIATLIYKTRKNPLQDMLHINPIVWQYAIGKALTRPQVENLVDWQQQTAGRLRGIRLIAKGSRLYWGRFLTSAMLYILSFIRFNYEYIIGLGILIGLTVGYTNYQQIDMEWDLIMLLCGIAVILAFLIHKIGVHNDLSRFKQEVKKILLQTPQGLNPASKTVVVYYPYTVCLGFAREWSQRLRQNNPAYNRLLFLTKEAKQ